MKTKIVTTLLACLFIVSVSTKSLAVSTSATGTIGVPVKINIPSSYTITLPDSLALAKSTEKFENTYTIKAKGDITGTEILSVIPDTSVTLSSEGKQSIPATITQSVKTFTFSDIKVEKSINGLVSATGITAGMWSGTLNFVITLK